MVSKFFIKKVLLAIFPLIEITGISLLDDIIWHVIIYGAVLLATIICVRIKSRNWKKMYIDAALVLTLIGYCNIGQIMNVFLGIVAIILGIIVGYWGYRVTSLLVESA